MTDNYTIRPGWNYRVIAQPVRVMPTDPDNTATVTQYRIAEVYYDSVTGAPSGWCEASLVTDDDPADLRNDLLAMMAGSVKPVIHVTENGDFQ